MSRESASEFVGFHTLEQKADMIVFVFFIAPLEVLPSIEMSNILDCKSLLNLIPLRMPSMKGGSIGCFSIDGCITRVSNPAFHKASVEVCHIGIVDECSPRFDRLSCVDNSGWFYFEPRYEALGLK